ncbi:DNA gyrase inhibitor YacG [Chelativorans salis]|uniref:DNA gyrase inhibitor YacG n=1 Tax=Chelativorans salis TaxID=2978478 RepID=A0ABT2LI37_9HYPH|nr:DNA gyrase inhibitor YacG [Chelativorans sp. EGI FJ00035]MCT7373959.1 DNA gyrase inhibitor YacG [Chelativorans sp. EGI FJ00035]
MPNNVPDKITPLRPKRPCPECGKPSERAFYPFCSKRCKEIDLNRWFSGAYVIPGRPTEDGDDEPPSE